MPSCVFFKRTRWSHQRPAAAGIARRVLDCNKDELPNSLTDAEAKQCQKGDELYEVPRFISLNEGLVIVPATRDVVGGGH